MRWVKTYLILLVIITFIKYHQCRRFGGGRYLNHTNVDPKVFTIDEKKPALEPLALRTTPRFRSTTRRATSPTVPWLTRSWSTTPRRWSTSSRLRSTTPRPRTTTPRPRTTTPRPRTTTPRPRTTTPRPRATTPRPRTTTPRLRTTTPRPRTTTPRPRTTTPRPRTTTPRPRTTTPRPRTTTHRTTTATTRRWTTTWTTRRRITTKTTTTTSRPTTRKHTTTRAPTSTSGQLPFHDHYAIEKKYNYNYNGHFSMPQPHPAYHEYYLIRPTYTYQQSDTGSDLLGFYLGYKLGQLTTPTYAHKSFYVRYAPQYDHYTVHHYYHNAVAEPKFHNIHSSNIKSCVGNTRDVCPEGTISLCTSDGRLMCVASAPTVVSCMDTNNKSVTCTRSTISCDKNDAKECEGRNGTSINVDIPCLATVKIEGTVGNVNNTIQRISSKTLLSKESSKTLNGTYISTPYPITTNNKTSVLLNSTTQQISPSSKITLSSNETLEPVDSTYNNSTPYPITTTPSQEISVPVDSTTQIIPLSSENNTVTPIFNDTLVSRETDGTYNFSTPYPITTTPNENTSVLLVNTTQQLSPSSESNTFTSKIDDILPLGDNNNTTPPYPITTTPSNETSVLLGNTAQQISPNSESSVPTTTDFCVIVVAKPAKRQITEGEEFLNEASNILELFIKQSWNI